MKCSEHIFSDTRFLVSNDEWGSRAVLVQEGRVVEYFFERRGRPSLIGSIYLGKVRNVHPGLSSAFVDIGLERNGFVTLDSIAYGDADDVGDEKPRPPREDDVVIVQVTKQPRGRKGARLTLRVSIAGRYLVLIPNSNAIGVSRRLEEAERDRLHELIVDIRPPGYGLIARTLGCEATKAELERELLWLVEQWHAIRALAGRKKPPHLLYREPELPVRLARDLVSRLTAEVVVDDPAVMGQVRNYLARYDAELARKVRLHTGTRPLFEEYGIEKQLARMRERVVWLPSGGYIAFDRTEALTTIDVNSGKNVSERSFAETALVTNLEAAREIPRQVRLRDISGIIVVDFIDVADPDGVAAIEEELRHGFSLDRSPVQVFGMSPIGLVEITRKSVSQSERDYFVQECPHCKGQGWIRSDDDLIVEVLRTLKRVVMSAGQDHLYVRVGERLFRLFSGEFSFELKKLIDCTGTMVTLLPDASLSEFEFAIDYAVRSVDGCSPTPSWGDEALQDFAAAETSPVRSSAAEGDRADRSGNDEAGEERFS